MADNYTATFSMVGNHDGITFSQSTNKAATGKEGRRVSIAAAKTGELTTRTDGDTGTLTMDGGHGITDGQKIDIYGPDGALYGATVGTVSVNSVPFDGGTGALPSLNSDVTVKVPEVFSCTVNGDDVVMILTKSPVAGRIAFQNAENAEIVAYTFTAAGGQVWSSETGQANPLFEEAVAFVSFSHASSTGAKAMIGEILFGAP